MAEPFLSEIRIFSFNYPPQGWAFCDGQLLPINQYTALFSLMGTFYGGNGVQNFALPDLQGRVAIHQGGSYVIGESSGEQNHTLTVAEMPAHSHTLHVSGLATTTDPTGALFAGPPIITKAGGPYSNTGGSTASPGVIDPAGSSQPHQNMMPFASLNFCIAMVGIFPSRN